MSKTTLRFKKSLHTLSERPKFESGNAAVLEHSEYCVHKIRSRTGLSRGVLKKITHLTLVVSGVLALSACETIQRRDPIVVMPDAEVISISNRGSMNNLFGAGSLQIGEFSVANIERSSTSSSSFSIGPFSETKSTSSFRFVVASGAVASGAAASGAAAWKVDCKKNADGNVLKVFGVNTYAKKVSLSCDMANGQKRASFVLRDENEPLKGELIIGSDRFTIHQYAFRPGHHEIIAKAVGFTIESGENKIAAVDFRYEGTFHFKRGLSQADKEPLAAVMAAIYINENS